MADLHARLSQIDPGKAAAPDRNGNRLLIILISDALNKAVVAEFELAVPEGECIRTDQIDNCSRPVLDDVLHIGVWILGVNLSLTSG